MTRFTEHLDPTDKETHAFALSKRQIAVIVLPNQCHAYVTLLRSGSLRCSERATVRIVQVASEEVVAETHRLYIRYRSTKVSPGHYNLRRVDGSDAFRFNEHHIGWSFASRHAIFLYPPTGSRYAVIDR